MRSRLGRERRGSAVGLGAGGGARAGRRPRGAQALARAARGCSAGAQLEARGCKLT